MPLNRRVYQCAQDGIEDPATEKGVSLHLTTGEPLENGRHWFDDAVVEAKLKNFHWHDMRHTVANDGSAARGY